MFLLTSNHMMVISLLTKLNRRPLLRELSKLVLSTLPLMRQLHYPHQLKSLLQALAQMMQKRILNSKILSSMLKDFQLKQMALHMIELSNLELSTIMSQLPMMMIYQHQVSVQKVKLQAGLTQFIMMKHCSL